MALLLVTAALAMHWHSIAIASGAPYLDGAPLAGDGATVAWQQDRRSVVVVSDGRRQTVRIPASCGGWLRAAGAGYLLFSCDRYHFAVMDVATRHVKSITWDPMRNGSDVPEFDAIGRQWIAGGSTSYHAEDLTVYLNWRTGAQTTNGSESSPRRYPDLSDPNLEHPLCAPLRRHREPGSTESELTYWPVAVSGGWVHDDSSPNVLRQCGTARRLRFSSAVALQGGVATWTTSAGGVLHALRLGDQARFSGRDPAGVRRLVTTPHAMYAARPFNGEDYRVTTRWRILRARLAQTS